MSTLERVRYGMKWAGSALGAIRLARFLTTIVLARLLAPEAFGLVAMANVAIVTLGVIRELGFGAAFIQRRDEDPEDERRAAGTFFALGLAVHAVLFVAAQAATPAIAGFFAMDGLAPVLRAMFLVFVIDGLALVPSYLLQKRLDFQRHALCEIAEAVVYAGTALGLAAAGLGVWSLVAGHLASRCVFGTAAWILSGWRPQWDFDATVARELFAFGRYLWAFSLVSAIGSVLDRAVIGRLLGAAPLGAYNVGFQLCRMPATQVNMVINRIAFPAFAERQREIPVLRRGFLQATSQLALLAIPLAVGLSITAGDFMRVVYGEKWLMAVPAVEVLAFWGMALALSSIGGPLLKALARPDLLLWTGLAHQGVLFALLWALAGRGLAGVAWAVLCPMILSAAVSYLLASRLLDIPLPQLAGPLVRAGLCAGGMVAAIVAVRGAGAAALPWPALRLAIDAGVGAAAYLVLALALNRSVLWGFAASLRGILQSRRATT